MEEMSSVRTYKSAVKAATHIFKSNFSEELKNFSNELFEKYPEMESWGWTQYTPYFMDGDPCEFDIQHARLNRFHFDSWGGGFYYDGEGFENLESAGKEVTKFVNSIRKCAPALESIFGDHSEIFIDKDGDISIEEHEHD